MAQSIHVALKAHPANPERFHQRIEVTMTLAADGGLNLLYAIHGFNLDLRVPTPHAPAPAEALWRTTCCELFVGAPDRPGYREFNFSPSGQWAAYDFADTRQPAASPAVLPAPTLQTRRSEDLLEVAVNLPAAALPAFGERRCLALAAVLEAEGGHLGYWALAHPHGKPDFHHPAGFLIKLDSRGLHP
ncbi:MAG: DOMON-like domain-containing protein [Rhodocyclaceae bacterium]|nr:DOMON-like domain-containing protein [Rhodocyclaceae bacterium]